jgi:mRNA-degrading endonuclease RelE of RelBE toxin-antitoxin system
MPNDEARQLEFTLEFKRNLRRLAQRDRRIRSDMKPVIEQIERGETPGDQIPRTGYSVFKVRIRNSDAQRGKSGGYRLLYYLQTPERVILVTLYSKSDQGDISAAEIGRIIEAHEAP